MDGLISEPFNCSEGEIDMKQQIPQLVTEVMSNYISLINKRFPNLLEGVYIQGSIALNAYVEGSSDIDFVTVMSRRLLEVDIDVLSKIHREIANTYNSIEMDGVYIVWDDLGKAAIHENSYPVYNSGEIRIESFINPITWWLLKTKGICIVGPECTSFTYETIPHDLLAYVNSNMNTYWANRTTSLESAFNQISKYSKEEINTTIEWSVLGLLRQYYTLMEQDIISKVDAGEYGLKHVPTEWHPIVNEAINIRKGVKNNHYTSDEQRVKDTIGFSKYIISYCNTHLLKV